MEQTTGRLGVLGSANSTGHAKDEVVRLRAAALRLSFAFQGTNPKLDRALTQLSRAARGSDRHLNVADVVDDIVAIVTESNPAETQRNAGAAAIRRSFDLFLATLIVPHDEDLQALINDARARLQRAREESQLLGLVEETARRISLELADAGADGAVGPSEIGRNSLLELLDQVHLPAEFESQTRALRASLGNPQAPAQIYKTAQAIADLLQRAHRHARIEVERLSGFLKQVLARIELLRQQLKLANSTRTETARLSEAFTQSVNGHVQEIQSNIESALTLDGLKASVTENLRYINDDVDTFVETERQRNRETEELFATLSAQMQALEGETQLLRDGINQERVRAATDALTGVPNRLAFDLQVAHEFDRWRGSGGDLSAIFIDIDRFKTINDTYGHPTGDKVLKTVADQLRSQIRQSDLLARYGGEEFVVLLPNASLLQAATIAEKLRAHIERCHFHCRAHDVPVTISLGVAAFHHGDDPDGVFDRADRALYMAKNRGRNRCCDERDLIGE